MPMLVRAALNDRLLLRKALVPPMFQSTSDALTPNLSLVAASVVSMGSTDESA